MKAKLEINDVTEISFPQVMDYYFSNWSSEEKSNFLWNETCFPFDVEKTLDQIYEYYVKNLA